MTPEISRIRLVDLSRCSNKFSKVLGGARAALEGLLDVTWAPARRAPLCLAEGSEPCSCRHGRLNSKELAVVEVPVPAGKSPILFFVRVFSPVGGKSVFKNAP